MKFTPRLDEENVNISKTSPIKELFSLLAVILGAFFAIYIILGLCLDVIVQKIPPKVEKSLGNFYGKLYKVDDSRSPSELELQNILNKLTAKISDKNFDFKVHINKSNKANAFALPGGNIVVLSKLIEEAESENEVAMVLAHELGHFVNRDHLRGLGRNLVFMVLSSTLFGVDSSVTKFMQSALLNVELKFSRDQEVAADIFGLDLLNKTYGNSTGAIDFFKRIKEKQKMPSFLYFFSTHPYHDDRIRIINNRIKDKNYLRKEAIPLANGFKRDIKKKQSDSCY